MLRKQSQHILKINVGFAYSIVVTRKAKTVKYNSRFSFLVMYQSKES